ncbi:MAG: LysM peptidoglycan-binding domain-containing protein [Epulopiscium sp.]|nr:LysM peptidoglycan-binding domain-containing protein [Candidatus Epulonipiscium sp.]
MKRMIARTLFFILLIGAPINAYASSYIMHTVQQGDNVTTISQKYNISSNQINSLNGKSELYIGNLLKLRPIAGNKTIKVFLDNKAIVTDEAPYMEGGLTFVPIRFIAEAIGVKDINWNNDNEEAILMKNSVILRLPIRKTYAFINDETIELDAPINIYKGRTFVPLRFVAEAFDLNVEWDEGNAYVRLFTDQYVEKRSQETVISPVLSYSEEDIYWLSRIVEAEAGGGTL